MTPPHQQGEFDESDPRFQVRILAMRLDTVVREKEEIEGEYRELAKRVSAMEQSFQRGAGALIVLPIVGTIVGLLFAYGKAIFSPWLKP